MNIENLKQMVDEETLYEIMSEVKRRVQDEDADPTALLARLLMLELDRQYEQEREQERETYEHEAYATWED